MNIGMIKIGVQKAINFFPYDLGCDLQVSMLFFILKQVLVIVNHDAFCGKVFDIGVRDVMLDWFSSYVCWRINFVGYTSIDKQVSLVNRILEGLKGLRLYPGLILFLLLVNSLSTKVQLSNACQYADEISLSLSGHSWVFEANILHWMEYITLVK